MRRNIFAFFLSLILSAPFTASASDAMLQKNGCVNKRVFDADWRKYSDFDSTDPLQSGSWEAQQYDATKQESKEAKLEIAKLTAYMELDREKRLAMRDYQQAIEKGLKVNLLKAFWRMTWITYNTIGGPTGKSELVGTGKELAELVTEPFISEFITDASKIATTGKVLGVVKELLPKQYAKFSEETGVKGKAGNTGVDAVLEGMKDLDDRPDHMASKVVSKIMETGGKEMLGDAELSDAELDILRKQNIEHQHLKKAIEENYVVNGKRRDRIDELNAKIADAEKRAAEWDGKEKERVFAKLNTHCNQCGPGYRWDEGKADCVDDKAAQVAAARCDYPNSEPYWNEGVHKVLCHCTKGYIWNGNKTVCGIDKAGLVAAAKCSYPNSEAYWDEGKNTPLCRCLKGYLWNQGQTACVVDKASLVATADCSGTPNSRAYWDDELDRVQCLFCQPGYRWATDTGLDCVEDNSTSNEQNPFEGVLERITTQLQEGNRQLEAQNETWGKPRSDVDNRGNDAAADKDAALQQCIQCVNGLIGGACYVRIPRLAGWGLCVSCTKDGGVAVENRFVDRDKCPVCQKAPWKLEDFKAFKHN